MKNSIILNISKTLNFLSPFITKNLIRLGNKGDGGYVIPKQLINKIETLVSFGISNDWSFERDFKKLNPDLIIHAYDHTISRRVFLKNIRYILLDMILLKFSFKKLINSISQFFSYLIFFKGNITHFKNRIHNYKHHFYDITFDDVILKTTSKNIFLKVDIEGSEYRIIDSIIKHANKIDGLAIEFHNADSFRPIFIPAIKKLLKKFKIVHLHANNYAGNAKDGMPECSEITFINNKIKIRTYKKRKVLPLLGLDFQNATSKVDYKLIFN